MSNPIASAVSSLMGGGSAQTEEDNNTQSGNNTGNNPQSSYADQSGTGNQMNPGGMTQGYSGGRGGLFPSGSGEGDEPLPKAGRGDKQTADQKTV